MNPNNWKGRETLEGREKVAGLLLDFGEGTLGSLQERGASGGYAEGAQQGILLDPRKTELGSISCC